MIMAEYTVTGKFRMKGKEQNFTKEVEAKSEHQAIHLVTSQIGSRHQALKHMIKIEKVELKK